jgi:L-iditol 2-dehydrogenase
LVDWSVVIKLRVMKIHHAERDENHHAERDDYTGEGSVFMATVSEKPALMRQAVIVTPERFEVRSAARPTLRDPGDLLIRTAACGICSGDLMPWYLAKKIGTVLGHEMVGWAVEVGPAVEGINPGDLVFFHHHAPCLHCDDCARAAYVHCRTWRSSSIEPGGMAEWVRVPAVNVRGDTFAVNGLTVEQAIYIEPLGCSVKALCRLRAILPLPGTSGAVIGCGIMGLLNIEAALALGAREVYAVEPDADRRQAALTAGACQALTPDEAGATLKERLDFVIIGPGHPEVIRQALALVRPAGSAVLFTPTASGVTTSLDLGDLYFREINLIPSYSCGPDDTRLARDLLRRLRVRPERFITHRFRLDDVQTAYDTARRGGPTLKVLILMAEEANL